MSNVDIDQLASEYASKRGEVDSEVLLGLDQISHAMGQAGVAATTIRNHLAAERPLRR